MNDELSTTLTLLKERLYLAPTDDLILDAKAVMALYPREALPDWVEILANGNPEMLASVVDVAKADIAAEAENDHKTEHGQAQIALIPVLLLLALAVLAVMMLMAATRGPAINLSAFLPQVDLSSSHGVPKHKTAALQVRDCLSQKGALQEWINPKTGRHALLCEVEPGRYGIQIIEQQGGIWKEITAFLKDKMTRIEQVSQYLQNSGYTLVQ